METNNQRVNPKDKATFSDSVKLARNWTKARVLDCLGGQQKQELVRFLGERYTERFFSPIRCLREAPGNEQGYGFAIMALCCLLVETIQCYREGLPSSSDNDLDYMEKLPLNNDPEYKLPTPRPFKEGKDPFVIFFRDDRHKTYFPDVDGEEFYKKIRCGLLHQAQTKGSWRLGRTGKYWDAAEKSINRDEFAQRLRECFEGYLRELSEHSWNDETIWVPARRKIWWLAKTS